MSSDLHPDLTALVARIDSELVFAQVLITRRDSPGSFEMRHVDDRDCSADKLTPTRISELRSLAQTTERGAFRPLKSAPHLRRGWVASTRSEEDLKTALGHLYPGALADWHAVESGAASTTDYASYAGRQTGMYQSTCKLRGAAADRMIRACCHPDQCLKRRLWTGPSLPPDQGSQKSLIPCLEPCALLLEFARSVWKLEQAEAVPIRLSSAEIQVVQWALHQALQPGAPLGSPAREGDFQAEDNPRKVRWILEKLQLPS